MWAKIRIFEANTTKQNLLRFGLRFIHHLASTTLTAIINLLLDAIIHVNVKYPLKALNFGL